MSTNKAKNEVVPALRVNQWLGDWDQVKWNKSAGRAEPQKWFYQFSMKAGMLRSLSGIYPRTTQNRKRGKSDRGIQRRHEKNRSKKIHEYVRYGYPWSELSKSNRESGEYTELRKPGWLPTAIVVNILTPGAARAGKKINEDDVITVKDLSDGFAEIVAPKSYKNEGWKPTSISPVEVIDGQHRLWAFDEDSLAADFELPVVAFVGLDLSWQAYLFYTINIKPKKINASLAFDLYPLLRTEEWLTKFEGHAVYREARAQELVDLLWSYKESPWYHRINMLGEPGHKGTMVNQASWVRSLLASFVKSWAGRGTGIGGIFGSLVGENKTVLPWTRAEQAAFLIVAYELLQNSVYKTDTKWTKALRDQGLPDLFDDNDDMAFYGPNSLINQDQGVRTILQVVNDLVYVSADDLSLIEWGGQHQDGSDDDRIKDAVSSLKKKRKILSFLKSLMQSLSTFDWRASSAPGLSEDEIIYKAALRGGGGYKLLRTQVLQHLAKSKGPAKLVAKDVLKSLDY